MPMIKIRIWPCMLLLLFASSLGAEVSAKASRTSKTKSPEAQKGPGPMEFEAARRSITSGLSRVNPNWNLNFLLGYPSQGTGYCMRYRQILPELQVLTTAVGLDPAQLELQGQWRLHLAWFYESCEVVTTDPLKPVAWLRAMPGCSSMVIYPNRFEEAYQLYQEVSKTFPKQFTGGGKVDQLGGGRDLQRVANKIAEFHEVHFVEQGDPDDLCQAEGWRREHGFPAKAILKRKLEVRVAALEVALKKAKEELTAEQKVQQPVVARQ